MTWCCVRVWGRGVVELVKSPTIESPITIARLIRFVQERLVSKCDKALELSEVQIRDGVDRDKDLSEL